MKRNKRIRALVSLLLALLLVATAIFPAFAATGNNRRINEIYSQKQITNFDTTTTISQDNYVKKWINTKNMNPSEAIQFVCELFVSSIYASRHNDSYSFKPFLLSEALASMPKNETIAYYECKCEYERYISQMCDRETTSDHITFDNFSAKVDGNHCSAELGTHYCFSLKGDFNGTFYQNCSYYLELTQYDGLWRVASIKSNMPDELGDEFTYKAFDAYAAAKKATTPSRDEVDSENNSECVDVSCEDPDVFVPYANTSYVVYYAVNYAAQYFNTTNSAFGYNYSGGEPANCQNFASQCVWKGLMTGCGTDGSSIYTIPAVSTSLAGSSSNNVWCHNQSTSYYSNSYLNWAWDNVNGFLKLIAVSNHTKDGPQGNYYLGLSNAEAGDVIVWDTSGTRNLNNATFDHAMFVTQVTGSAGSRTPANICIAANSSATVSAYMPLTNYTSLGASYFATAHITGGYYRVQQDYPPVQ